MMRPHPKSHVVRSRWGDYTLTETPCDCQPEWERALEIIEEMMRLVPAQKLAAVTEKTAA